jgi:general secretion pathway protein F
MPIYAYKGVTAGSRTASGTVDADSMRDARLKLRTEGIVPTQLTEGKAGTQISEALASLKLPSLRQVPDLELALFTDQLATLLDAGVPLVQALDVLTDQIENLQLKSAVGQVREEINQGANLADAMGNHAEIFDGLYCSMVRAGESAGALDTVLQRMASYISGRMKLTNQIRSAMMYPMIVLLMSVVMMGVLMVVVIPSIAEILTGKGQDIPLPTAIVIGASNLVTGYWQWGIAGTLGGVLAFSWALRTEAGRLKWDTVKLRMPILGRVTRLISISRFARTLATLLSGGVSIVQALEIACTTSGNGVIARAVRKAGDAITQGTSIAQPLRQSGEFPPLVTHMISVGEASGELPAMLEKISDTYEALVEGSLTRMLSLLEPLLLVGVAGLVVVIILSVILPLINITASI